MKEWSYRFKARYGDSGYISGECRNLNNFISLAKRSESLKHVDF